MKITIETLIDTMNIERSPDVEKIKAIVREALIIGLKDCTGHFMENDPNKVEVHISKLINTVNIYKD